MSSKYFRNLFFVLIVLLAVTARADVRLPQIFGDGMLLQRDKPIAVWGWADPNEKVLVSFSDHTVATVTDELGRWRIALPALSADSTSRDLSVRGKNTVTLREVVVGDVWFCSGQSNMSISVGHFVAVPEVKQDIAAAKYPLIRHFGVKENFADEIQDDVSGTWLTCSPQTVSQFCAVGFYFARKVHAESGIPIGIVRSAKGSTSIEMWLSQEMLLNTPVFESYAVKMRESLARWERSKVAALQNNIPANSPDFPPFPFGEKVRSPRCVTLHNGMIAPLVNLTIRGILWYQGEGNAGDAMVAQAYLAKQQALIRELRKTFGDEALPFYYVQLPAYRDASEVPAGGGSWPMLRESQRKCLSTPHTGMAVTIDIGDANDIHPTNKVDVGERIARWALKNEYGKKDLVTSGPLFRDLQIRGDKARVHFESTSSRLMIGTKKGRSPVVEDKQGKLQGFAVAGADRKWHWAQATIDGETVVVHSPEVTDPVAVRYAFSANPTGANLYNDSGLPASPFRSDDW
jgi:sialate O-acetylesterase